MSEVFLTDLDHTFLRNDLTVSNFSKNVWNKMALRHTMSVATARAHKKTKQFLQNLNINAPMVLLDGSLIVADDKIIDKKTLNKEITTEIINLGLKHALKPFILAQKGKKLNEVFLYPKDGNEYQSKLLSRYINDDHLVLVDDAYAMDENFKISYMADEKILTKFAKELHEIFADNIKYILAPEAYMGCFYLTVLNPQADKSTGLQIINDYLNLDFKNYTVFGDNFNDIGMFELAGTSVAVANAQIKVKELADIVLPHTNDEDAVAKYLKKLNL